MDLDDAQRILELNAFATVADAERAYRRLAMRWHPDRNSDPTAGARMARLNQAIYVVRELGQNAGHPFAGASASAGARERARAGQGGSSFDDWWEGFTSTHRYEDADPTSQGKQAQDEQPRQYRARDIRRKLKITLMEAAFGAVKTLKGTITDSCAACAGMGERHVVCPTCHGTGTNHMRRASMFHSCPDCLGHRGSWRTCAQCAGAGKLARRQWEFQITVPPGTLPDTRLRARGAGERGGPGGIDGDLIATVEIAPHPWFEFDESQRLNVRVPVSALRWIAGGTVVAPTLFGFAQAELAPRQTRIVLAGEGWPHRAAARGDLVVNIEPVYPEAITPAQQQQLLQLEKELHCPELRLWDKQMLHWASAEARHRGAKKGRR